MDDSQPRISADSTIDTTSTSTPTPVTEAVLPGIVEPDGIQVRTRPARPAGPGQVVLVMEAAGISFAEQQMRRGKYYDQPPFPFVPGYDLVGRAVEVGEGVPGGLLGRRFAVLTKTGAWASHVTVDAGDLTEVPDAVDSADAETFVVNGITAWQMLHRLAKVRPGHTVLVHGANGGVGSTLVQLARIAGARVVGTASAKHHDAVRALGAVPVDYRAPDMDARLRAHAPQGYDAVFDHVGGEGIVASYRLLAAKGTLVSYGSASTRDVEGSSKAPVLKLFARLALWNALPSGKGAHFYNIWAGRRRLATFRAKLHTDLTQVLALLADGRLIPQVAARIPLTEVGKAVRLAESGTVVGKVVLVP
ncbi:MULTISPECIES: medium chain dehydrogenase/reductase family protein [unclassified Streptomyces]|uniref:medium chain dehydrogenase/reductase family protein n=1 Tax=unclassified Streptomyces TaxID=2593676 RepID=UPI0033D08E41